MVRLFTAPFELLGVRQGRWASRWLSGCNRNRCPRVLRVMSLLPKRWTTGNRLVQRWAKSISVGVVPAGTYAATGSMLRWVVR